MFFWDRVNKNLFEKYAASKPKNDNVRFCIVPNSNYDEFRKELYRVARLPQGKMIYQSIKVGETPSVLKLLRY